MKLLFVSHTPNLGGAERSLITIMNSLKERYDVSVLVPSSGSLLRKAAGINYFISHFDWWTLPRGSKRTEMKDSLNKHIKQANYAVRALEGYKPDIIYTNTSVICIGAIISNLLKSKHIWHIREYGERDHGFIFEYGLEATSKYINDNSNRVIFNSRATRNQFKLIKDEKSTIIYNAIEIENNSIRSDKKYYIYTDSVKLIIVGTISVRKGQEDAVKAATSLINKGINIELILVGHLNDKVLEKRLKSIILSCREPRRIQILGYTDNPYPIIKYADILLVTSKNEAFGRTILEGWYFEKAVIGTAAGGIPEIIDSDINGKLYEPGNIHSLESIIHNLYNNSEFRMSLGKNGNLKLKGKFSISEYINSIESVINGL